MEGRKAIRCKVVSQCREIQEPHDKACAWNSHQYGTLIGYPCRIVSKHTTVAQLLKCSRSLTPLYLSTHYSLSQECCSWPAFFIFSFHLRQHSHEAFLDTFPLTASGPSSHVLLQYLGLLSSMEFVKLNCNYV